MEKVLNSYETLFIVDASKPEEEVKALVNKFTSLVADNATVESVNEWGKRRMAYPINDTVDGYYVLLNYKSEATFPLEFQRIAGITDGMLRAMTVRLEDQEATAVAADAEAAVETPAAE